MYSKAKYWVGKIAGILAILMGLTFLGSLMWLIGIQGSEVKGGLGLLVLVLNLLLVIVPAIIFVLFGMRLSAKPRIGNDNPSGGIVWIFASNKKVIILIVLCLLFLVMNCVKMPISNFHAWFKVKPFRIVRIGNWLTNIRIRGKWYSVFNTLDTPQTILKWVQVGLCACTAILATVFLFLKPVAKTAEKTENADVESDEINE